MVDIHSHILYGVDDGAKDLSESLAMASTYLQQGIRTVVATPHFDILKDNYDEFISLRDKNLEILRKSLVETDLNLEVLSGAELYFRRELLDIDLTPFLVEGTDYLLIELPTRSVPGGIKTFFEELIYQGFNPVLVHIERYGVLRDDTQLLYELAEIGVLFQVNNETVIDGLDSFMKACFKKNYVSFMGSDAHGLHKRVINYNKLEEKVDLRTFNSNSINLINNRSVDSLVKKKIIKILGRFK